MVYRSRGRPREQGNEGEGRCGVGGWGQRGAKAGSVAGKLKMIRPVLIIVPRTGAKQRDAMHLRFTPPCPGRAKLTGGRYCQWETPYGVKSMRLGQGIAHLIYPLPNLDRTTAA